MPDATDVEVLTRCRQMAAENLSEMQELLPLLRQETDKNNLNQAIYLNKTLIADIDSILDKWNNVKKS